MQSVGCGVSGLGLRACSQATTSSPSACFQEEQEGGTHFPRRLKKVQGSEGGVSLEKQRAKGSGFGLISSEGLRVCLLSSEGLRVCPLSSKGFRVWPAKQQKVWGLA